MTFTKFYTFVCQRAVILQGEGIQGKPKQSCQLFFHEESIHEVSRRYLNAPYIRTDKPKPICPHFFKVGGIKTYESRINKLYKGCITLQENNGTIYQKCTHLDLSSM